MTGNAVISRDNPFYEGRVPIRVEGDGTNSVNEILTLRIFPGYKKSSSQQRVGLMHMEITNDNDPFFLYSMQVSEEEFHQLKTEQSLLVDFKLFPPKLVELIEGCVNANREKHSGSNAADKAGKIIAVFDMSENPEFKLVEANQFRQLTHLSLRLEAATDTSLKRYLAGRLQIAKSEIARCNEEVDNLRTKLEAKNAFAKTQSDDLSSLRDELASIKDKLNRTHEEEMARQKQESILLLSETQAAASKQAQKQQENLEKRVNDLESQLVTFQNDNRNLYQEKSELESECHHLRSKLESLEKVSSETDVELNELRQKNREMEGIRFEMEKQISEQQFSLVALQQRVADKEEVVIKSSAMLEESERKVNACEEKVKRYKATTGKLQRKLELSIKEINKGNTIIETIQQELKIAKEKIRTKNMVIRQQEKAIEEVTHQQQTESAAKKRVAEDLETEKKTTAELRKALDNCKSEIIESNKTLESNQNVITFLNKELNRRPGSTGKDGYATTEGTSRRPVGDKSYTPHTLTPTIRNTIYKNSFESPLNKSPPPFSESRDLFPSPLQKFENGGDISNLTLQENIT